LWIVARLTPNTSASWIRLAKCSLGRARTTG
jgi:hypothetical protein